MCKMWKWAILEHLRDTEVSRTFLKTAFAPKNYFLLHRPKIQLAPLFHTIFCVDRDSDLEFAKFFFRIMHYTANLSSRTILIIFQRCNTRYRGHYPTIWDLILCNGMHGLETQNFFPWSPFCNTNSKFDVPNCRLHSKFSIWSFLLTRIQFQKILQALQHLI